jgi:hypothetical protein
MKQLKKIVTALIMLAAVITIFQSCKKSDDTANYNADKSKLSLQIDTANALYNAAVEGKQAGEYSVGSKAIFKVSINLAQSVLTGNTFTQYQVNNALANLIRAEATFATNLIQQISAANQVAYWKFDGDATDASGNGFNGTLQTGWVGSTAATATDGATLPVLTTDRYGTANHAYYFNNGAYIEVPYNTALRPSSFTISAWIKPTVTNAGNYIISLDRWNGYKFQIQSNNFPYLTIMTDQGDLDIDDNPGAVQVNVWSQVAVSFTNGTMVFYINGKVSKTVTANGNPIPIGTITNLSIGNEMPKEAYNFTNTSSPNYFYGASYFMGSIDDVHLYNTVLTPTQINSLYTMEQP